MCDHPHLYTVGRTGEQRKYWLRWEASYRLDVPVEVISTPSRDNAAALCDWREYDGYIYLIYTGNNAVRQGELRGQAALRPWPRGWNKLGLARSRDLVRWLPAGAEGG